MKILVIEDNQLHIDAAKSQLAEHDVTICNNFREAEKILAGANIGCWYKEDAQFPFDAVLTDLFLPPSPVGTLCTGYDEEKVDPADIAKAIEEFGNEIPYGLVIALASMRRGVPVAIVSDKSHHGHPINWALDLVSSKEKLLLGTLPFLSKQGCRGKDANGNYVKQWKNVLDILMKEA
jgi:CheY-like chemotaxis protein